MGSARSIAACLVVGAFCALAVACARTWPARLPGDDIGIAAPAGTPDAGIPANETITVLRTPTPTRTATATPTRTPTATPTTGAIPAIVLTPFAAGLSAPVAITHAGDGSGRIFVTEQGGTVRIIEGGAVLAQPFLDITALVSCCGERGLLSVAFHPDYETNRYFYVNYTNTEGDTVVARYRRNATNPRLADAGSASLVIGIDQPYANHNGGQLQFGPDGYLYIGMGDGGSSGDPQNYAQNINSLLGKMLRLDVDSGSPYAIPPDNPYVGVAGADEVWAIGLRNPWRFSFDRANGDLWIGDVGQGSREEVNRAPASSDGGENYGWRLMEGSACYNPATNCNPGGLTLPVLEYTHVNGNCSLTGGYRYRGPIAPLNGVYFYADYCSGRVWGATQASPTAPWSSTMLLDSPYNVSTFGEDESGNVYVADISGGGVYRIVLAP